MGQMSKKATIEQIAADVKEVSIVIRVTDVNTTMPGPKTGPASP
jgi:hypothetical protein